MKTSTISALKSAALALGSATKHIGAASYEIGKVVFPIAGAAFGNVPKAAAATLETARSAETPEERKHAAAMLGIGVAVVAGLGIATVAHFASKRKKTRAYRQQKKQLKAAVAHEKEIDDALAQAAAIWPAQDVVGDTIEQDFSFMQDPGCFAILTYDPDSNERDLDLAAYRDVYVDSSDSVLAGVREQLEGKGNLYVHADVVYKRPMYVAFYPCSADDLSGLKEELAITLGADESYNKIHSMG